MPALHSRNLRHSLRIQTALGIRAFTPIIRIWLSTVLLQHPWIGTLVLPLCPDLTPMPLLSCRTSQEPSLPVLPSALSFLTLVPQTTSPLRGLTSKPCGLSSLTLSKISMVPP